jgi:very-short-patch-repair endonuclease
LSTAENRSRERQDRSGTLEFVLDSVLRRQSQVLSRSQALAGGLTPAKIKANLRAGRWQRLLPFVYATFTGPPPREAVLWAVVLRAGPGAVLSHQTAAELSGLQDQPTAPIHVTVPANRRPRPIPGVVIHRSARAERVRHPGPELPRTRVEETVVDLSQSARAAEPAIGWITTACARRLTTPERILRAINDRKRVRRRRLMIAVVDDAGTGCHSVLERHYLRDVERAHRLPRGRRQAVRKTATGRRYEDVRYDEYATVLELDGRATHPEERRRFDQRRDNEAAATGTRVLRYGWLDVSQPCVTAAQTARALQTGGWAGRPARCRRPTCVIRRTSRRRGDQVGG